MALSREPIYAALFARLKSKLSGTVKAFERRNRDWDQFSPAQQPALVQVIQDSTPENAEGLPPIWTLRVSLVIFFRGATDDKFNAVVDAVESALEQDANEATGFPYSSADHGQTTLGGLVRWARIGGGDVQVYHADANDQSAVLIPVEMLAV